MMTVLLPESQRLHSRLDRKTCIIGLVHFLTQAKSDHSHTTPALTSFRMAALGTLCSLTQDEVVTAPAVLEDELLEEDEHGGYQSAFARLYSISCSQVDINASIVEVNEFIRRSLLESNEVCHLSP